MKMQTVFTFMLFFLGSSISSAETEEDFRSYLREWHGASLGVAYTACFYKEGRVYLLIETTNPVGHLVEYRDEEILSITKLSVPARGDLTIIEMGETGLSEEEILKLSNKYVYYSLYGISPKADIMKIFSRIPAYACEI